jgi:hypothetical protein
MFGALLTSPTGLEPETPSDPSTANDSQSQPSNDLPEGEGPEDRE